MNIIRMPAFGGTLAEGTVVLWHRREGEHIQSGEPVAEIETAKAVFDLQADTDGVLRRILVQPGETVAAGTSLALIGAPTEPEPDLATLLSGQIPLEPEVVQGKQPLLLDRLTPFILALLVLIYLGLVVNALRQHQWVAVIADGMVALLLLVLLLFLQKRRRNRSHHM